MRITHLSSNPKEHYKQYVKMATGEKSDTVLGFVYGEDTYFFEDINGPSATRNYGEVWLQEEPKWDIGHLKESADRIVLLYEDGKVCWDKNIDRAIFRSYGASQAIVDGVMDAPKAKQAEDTSPS